MREPPPEHKGGFRVANTVGTMRATYVDPEGTEWDLSNINPDVGYFTTDGIGGWGAPPFEIVTDPVPRGGEAIRAIRSQASRLTWPLHIYADTHMQFITRYRALKRAILMTARRNLPGVLKVARPDGSARTIEVYYEDGFGGEPGENWVSANPVLTLFCPDGSWKDTEQMVITRVTEPASSFYTPWLTISSSQVIGSSVIVNPGDVHAWPVWTINGPATSITATNSTTGEAFTLTYAINVGQTITITTDRPTVRGPAGENIAGSLNWPGAWLWGLAPGNNNVTFTVAGAGTGTQIRMAFYPRYEGA